MKKIILVLTIVFAGVLACHGQNKLPSKEAVEAFLNSKTKVVLEETNMTYNAIIKEAVKKYWTITDYEFISYKEFRKQKNHTEFSFLLTTQVRLGSDRLPVKYTYLNLINGKVGGNLTSMPEMVSLPISYAGDVESNHYYKLPIIIKFIQNHIDNLQNHRFGLSLRKMKYYNKFKSDIEDKKELWIAKKDLTDPVDSKEEIEEYYDAKLKIVDHEKIKKAIKQEKENVVFLHKVGPERKEGWTARCYKLIFDTDKGKLYYYKYHEISEDKPDGFLPKDFKRLD